MDKGIKGVLNHVKEYIKDVFLDKELLLRDLYFTKKHTDIEYFNQASILMQKQDVECVMSMKCWKQEFQKEVQSKKLERGIAVLIPTLQEETITLRPYRVFDIHQLDLSKEEKNNYLLEHRSHLSIVIRTSNIQEYLKICNEIRWQKEMLVSYLKTFIFFKKSTQELQNFYYQCLVSTFNEELKITKQPIIEMINIKENECRRVYKNLHELISKLHF